MKLFDTVGSPHYQLPICFQGETQPAAFFTSAKSAEILHSHRSHVFEELKPSQRWDRGTTDVRLGPRWSKWEMPSGVLAIFGLVGKMMIEYDQFPVFPYFQQSSDQTHVDWANFLGMRLELLLFLSQETQQHCSTSPIISITSNWCSLVYIGFVSCFLIILLLFDCDGTLLIYLLLRSMFRFGMFRLLYRHPHHCRSKL